MHEEEEEIIDIGEDEKQELIDSGNSNGSSQPTMMIEDQDMDKDSRQLIEQMLAEEEYYFFNKTTKNYDSDYPKKTKDISSAALPSHKTRWNKEEDDRLKEALDIFGYGNWKPIAEHVGTRNRLQCKNHARHLLLVDKIKTPSKQKREESKEISKQTNTESETEMITADDADNTSDTTLPVNTTNTAGTTTTDVTMDTATVNEDGDDDLDIGDPVQDNNDKQLDDTTLMQNDDMKEEEEEDTAEQDEKEIKSDPLEREIDIPDNDTHVSISHFDRHFVSEEEKKQNPEWFQNKHAKTPDRYLRIRNHMLDCWNQCKPRYLTKTSARKGLKDCGDVNAIGRVHSYLESVGAINVDCITTAPRPPKRVPREVIVEEDTLDAADLVINYDGKVRNERGEWVDPRELEGRVIEHGVQVETDSNGTKSKRVKRSFHQHYYGGDDFNRGYDPFRLVPTSHYNELFPAPFEVEIVSDALLVMDFHAHLAHTEIIGLLGGNFIKKENAKILQVKSVFPCKSTSTGIQCEMDPESEMKAREVFAEQGYNVVGWYHSHPTFEPHPSIRDIENQTSYQTLFREAGDEPFIGVIVTPYNAEIQSDHSQFQYLHISTQWNETHSYKQCEQVSPSILDQFKELIQEYKDYEHKMDMTSSFGDSTRLEKLLYSLRAHLFIHEEQETAFLDQVKDMIEKNFMDTTTSNTTTPTDIVHNDNSNNNNSVA
ncbi:hypothetical protein RMATCC62417_08190 [Rhizopus microsporus]|nr:hypothetical protein RMATCC62417_08190 [Rhizopus microsporus]